MDQEKQPSQEAITHYQERQEALVKMAGLKEGPRSLKQAFNWDSCSLLFTYLLCDKPILELCFQMAPRHLRIYESESLGPREAPKGVDSTKICTRTKLWQVPHVCNFGAFCTLLPQERNGNGRYHWSSLDLKCWDLLKTGAKESGANQKYEMGWDALKTITPALIKESCP